MVEVDFSGNFTNADNCEANKIGVFIDEGELKDRTANGNTWKQSVMTVEVDQKQLKHSFRSSEGKRFQDEYGKDTKEWVGKKFKVTHVPWVDKSDVNNPQIRHNVELVPYNEEVKSTEEVEVPKEVESVQA